MTDTYALILWSEPSYESMDVQIYKVIEVLNILKKFGYPFDPNYITANKKSECRSLKIDYENIKSLLAKSKKQEEIDINLGVGKTIGFFSSLEEDESSSISISIGYSRIKSNTIVLRFPNNFDFKNDNLTIKITELFTQLVTVFKPFWGCITSYANSQNFGGYFNHKEGIPNSVFWINYWGKDIIDRLGLSKELMSAPFKDFYYADFLNDGVCFAPQEEVIEGILEKHLTYQKSINKKLSLT